MVATLKQKFAAWFRFLSSISIVVTLFLISTTRSDEFELSPGLRLKSLSSERETGGLSNSHHHQKPPVTCFARCVSGCAEIPSNSLRECETSCQKYGQESLCREHGHPPSPGCWPKCSDMGLPLVEDVQTLKELSIPRNFSAAYSEDFKINAKWDPTSAAVVYFVEVESEYVSDDLHLVTRHNSFLNLTLSPENYICGPMELKISAANKAGITAAGRFVLEKPKPVISAKMTLSSMTLEMVPYTFGDYRSESTIHIELGYSLKKWPFGSNDLEISPIFHMISCEVSDLESAIPQPEFKPGNKSETLVAKVSSDLMNRRCRFIFAIGEVRSKKCETTYQIFAGNSDYSSIFFDCETVKNSRCVKQQKPPAAPVCGQTKNFRFDIVNAENVDWSSPDVQISAKLQFESSAKRKPLYFIAVYGHATRFTEREKTLLLGVNMADVIGNGTNCAMFDRKGNCTQVSSENSIVLDNLKPNTLYGVTICFVFDPQNTTLPPIAQQSQQQRFLAEEILLSSSETNSEWFRPNTGIIITTLIIFMLITLLSCLLVWVKARRKANRKKQLKIEALKRQRPGDERYVDLPRKSDCWELERRNLIIYNDKKLGAGAFGAVFLGKMLGLPKNSEKNGLLNINLARLNSSSDSSSVAVKMLPEYADQISKSEFLREISLMKSLGYHERLVNMLACVTHSEPYCLVVEMCSDGDLLNFLRERCRYMLELSDAGINYADPECDADFNRDMIMSLRQLLAFMVQISYGLEYLTQKGFVHRDVAARNILVHDKQYAKIGDFGLCRFIYAESCNYKGHGGRLPVKWMSPEAIRYYEFTSSSDVWSFGVLMFEIITLGGSPYPGMQPDDILTFLESGGRINCPDNCPDQIYKIMSSCWQIDSRRRPEFSAIRKQLALQLEDLTDEYSYLKLDAQKDYYNVSYRERREQEAGERAIE